MTGVIVAFPRKEAIGKIKSILQKNGYEVSAVCLTGAHILQKAEQMDGGVIISGIRFPDMVYNEVRECLPENFEMMVVANARQWQEYGNDDVVYLPLPMRGFDLIDTLEDILAGLRRKMKKKEHRPKMRSASEQGLIDQAKMLLMEHHDYTEEEAHRYLQKVSMDSGTNLVETAGMILRLF